jgi:hypothetical protein
MTLFQLNAKAETGHLAVKKLVKPQPANDTPYLTRIQIVKPGEIDTPYLFFFAGAHQVDNEIETRLAGATGHFRAIIEFLAASGRVIRVEIRDYYPGRLNGHIANRRRVIKK